MMPELLGIGDDTAVVSSPIDPAALAVAAPYVDQFQITYLGGALVRLSFAEALDPGQGNYRAAVMLPAANARELALTILNILGAVPPAAS